MGSDCLEAFFFGAGAGFFPRIACFWGLDIGIILLLEKFVLPNVLPTQPLRAVVLVHPQ